MKTLEEVLTHAQEDEEFAAGLKAAAKDAAVAGIATDEWRHLMSYFNQTPEELDELEDPSLIEDPKLLLRTFTTILTFTSDICPETIYAATAEDSGESQLQMASRRAKVSTKQKKSQKKSAKTKRSTKKTAKANRPSKKSKKTKRSSR